MKKTKTAIIGTIIGELVFISMLGAVFYLSSPYVHSYIANPENQTNAAVLGLCLVFLVLVFLYNTMNRIVFRVRILLRKTNPLTDK